MYLRVKDISKIFMYALKNDTFKKIITTMQYKDMNHTIYDYKTRYNLSMNYLLGGKTGTEAKAGYCLASLAEYNNIKYMLITLNDPYPSSSPTHLIDAKNIYEYYMKNYNYHDIFQKGDILKEYNTKYLKEEKIQIKAEKDYSYYLENNYKKNLKIEYSGTDLITINDNIGKKLGTLYIYDKETLIDKIDIILNTEIHFSLYLYLTAHKDIVIIVTIILLLIILLLTLHKRKNE